MTETQEQFNKWYDANDDLTLRAALSAGWEAAQAQATHPDEFKCPICYDQKTTAEPVAWSRESVVVNLMRFANIDKHLARQIADKAFSCVPQPPDHTALLKQALEALECATTSIGSFTMDEGCGQVDFDNMDTCLAAIEAIKKAVNHDD